MRNLEKRLEKLEQEYTPAEPLVVMLDLRLSDKVLGMSLSEVPVRISSSRRPKESRSRSSTNRGAEHGQEYARSHPSMRQDHICVRVHWRDTCELNPAGHLLWH